VLYGACVGIQEIQCGSVVVCQSCQSSASGRANIQLVQKILLAQFTFSLSGVNPDGACQILGDKDHLTPVFSTLGVSLVGGTSAEGDGETDDETQNGEQESADC
jgi:hypothetical protein